MQRMPFYAAYIAYIRRQIHTLRMFKTNVTQFKRRQRKIRVTRARSRSTKNSLFHLYPCFLREKIDQKQDKCKMNKTEGTYNERSINVVQRTLFELCMKICVFCFFETYRLNVEICRQKGTVSYTVMREIKPSRHYPIEFKLQQPKTHAKTSLCQIGTQSYTKNSKS